MIVELKGCINLYKIVKYTSALYMDISAQVGAKIDFLAWPNGRQADQVDDIRHRDIYLTKASRNIVRVRVVYGLFMVINLVPPLA